jgi:sulfate-transporting ATPase
MRCHADAPLTLESALLLTRCHADAVLTRQPSAFAAQSPGEVKEGAAYAQETRRTILTMNKLTKSTPTGKQLLKNVSLGIYLGCAPPARSCLFPAYAHSAYPRAKIGILGANGAGKSTLMRVLAGVDTAFEGDVAVTKGLRVGYLPQEPQLDAGATVWDNIAPALAPMRAKLAEFESVSAKMGEAGADMDSLMARMTSLQEEIDAENGWELDRQADRAMDALRCPPRDAQVAVLSGGERRRVAICRLLLEKPEMLLLDGAFSLTCLMRPVHALTSFIPQSRRTIWTRSLWRGWSASWRTSRALWWL